MGRIRFGLVAGIAAAGFAIATAVFVAPQAVSSESGADVAAQPSEAFKHLVSDRTDLEIPLIYSGVDARNLGWVVALFQDGSYICSGSLIEVDVVLTAAHCVNDFGSYSVLLGETYLYAYGATRAVTEVVLHPSYGGSYIGTDLALLKLSSPATEFEPISLNRNASWPALYQEVAALGWGVYSDWSGASSWLQVGFMRATSSPGGSTDPYYCDLQSWERRDDFCIGGWVDDTTCRGDSGGPVVGMPSPSAVDGDWTLYGLVSYGATGCGNPYWDNKAQAIGPYIGWIDSIVASMSSGWFVDDDGSVHEADIEWLAEEGITRGCNPPTNDRYCPSSSVTRGQMAAFLRRALALPGASTDFFIDDDESVFQDDINALAAAGITKGCNPPTSDRFCPNSTITREQMAAFLKRAFGFPASGVDYFVDDDESIFEGDINAIAQAGVTMGCNPPANSRYCPRSPVKRDQMASFLRRAVTSTYSVGN